MFDNVSLLQPSQNATQRGNQNFFQPNLGLGANLTLGDQNVPAPITTRTPLGISSTVYFEQDGSFLDSQNFQVIESLKTDLQFLHNPRIIVNGFASSEGAAQSNQALSESRRDMVVALLSNANTLNPLTFEGQGMGESAEERGTAEEIESARGRNRRVDIQILYSPESISQSGGGGLSAARQRLHDQLRQDFIERMINENSQPNPLLIPTPPPSNGPLVPAGRGPDTPRAGTFGDILRAIMGVPAVRDGIDNLKQQALSELERSWDRLTPGERAVVITTTIVVGGGALTGALQDPQSRDFLLNQLDGRALPVPGTPLTITPQIQNRGVTITIDINRIINP